MAVPFNVPEADEPATSAARPSSAPTVPQPPHNPSGADRAAATHPHTMPRSPADNEYLVQAFCEALYRYTSAGGSLTTPPSPTITSSSVYSSDRYSDSYGGGNDMYFCFPDQVYDDFDFLYDAPRRYRSQSLPLATSYRPRTEVSTDDMHFPDHNYMDERYTNEVLWEQLPEFPGRVPQRATDSGNVQQQLNEQKPKSKPKENKLGWSMLLCLGTLVIGYGLLASR